MAYVYILSLYDEHGAENVKAMLNRDKLVAIAGDPNLWPRRGYASLTTGAYAEAAQTLATLLLKPDEELAGEQGNDLNKDWGGMQLHIVPLIE